MYHLHSTLFSSIASLFVTSVFNSLMRKALWEEKIEKDKRLKHTSHGPLVIMKKKIWNGAYKINDKGERTDLTCLYGLKLVLP